jgi:hypothetical protein
MSNRPFQRAAAKLSIASLDASDLLVEAQYNPKELQISQTVGWSDHESLAGQNQNTLTECGGTKPQTLSIELLFDGYETDGVAGKCAVEEHIARLKKLVTVRYPDSTKDHERRPHYCLVAWGERGVPPLRCVIESLTTKYTMFSRTGQVLRATVTVTVKEIDIAAIAREEAYREGMKNDMNRRRGYRV